jgi:predicted MFS family arabinose efflux permease
MPEVPRASWTRWVVAAAAAAALADGSIVTLALPTLLQELHTTVQGVAAVLIVYCAALAATLPLARWLAHLIGVRDVGIAGLVLFGGASLACAAAPSLPALLVFRTAQAVGAAGALLFAFRLLSPPARRERSSSGRLWRMSAVFGTAAGPALGGALTQAFSWQAIFLAQAPVVLAAAGLSLRLPAFPASVSNQTDPQPAPAVRGPRIAALALGLVSAALSAVLFLLVILLVSGGGLSPLHAALELSILPGAAILAARLRGPATLHAELGCLAVGAALLMLAFLPRPTLWWLLIPEILAGSGMGLALPALAGELLPERTAAQAGGLLSIRFGGIAFTLLALAPLISSQLYAATQRGRLQGVAALVASPLSPTTKLSIAPQLADAMNGQDARRALARTLARSGADLDATDHRALLVLGRQGDSIIFTVVSDGLRDGFLIAGGLGLLAALLIRPSRRGRATATAAAAASLVLAGTYVLVAQSDRPALPATGAPCRAAGLPSGSGITGFLQDAVLTVADHVACAQHVSREQLLLQIAGGGGP